MRVLVCSRELAGRSPSWAGELVAQSFAERGAQLALVSMGDARSDAVAALADLHELQLEPVAHPQLGEFAAGGEVLLVRASELPISPAPDSSSATVGELVLELAGSVAPPVIHLDPGEPNWRDGGAGFLEVVGDLLDATVLHLLVPYHETEYPLTGLRGLVSRQRDELNLGVDELLAADQTLVDLTHSWGRPDLATAPGGGASGGLGAAVLAMGGVVQSGPAACGETADLAASVAQSDLVVLVADQLDFGTMGGDVLAHLTAAAAAASVPVVVLARRNFVSSRELRIAGVQAAYSINVDDSPLTASALRAQAAVVARTWTWV